VSANALDFTGLDIYAYVATAISTVRGSGLKTQGTDIYYNLAGQRVDQPTKGLYIVNGKKVILVIFRS